MSWDLRLEPLNVDRTEWLVTAVEKNDATGLLLGETSERVLGDRDAAIAAGKRAALRVEEIRAARQAAELLTSVDLSSLPTPKVTEADVERARAALRRTEAVHEAAAADVVRLEQELAVARARDDAAQASVASDLAALQALEADLAAGR